MFEKFKDILLYETQFQRWLKLFDFPIRLEGNRVAEMHGQSPSVGMDYDVVLLRQLYNEKFPQALYWGKRSGQSSQDAAFRFVCELADTYAQVHGGEAARLPFAVVIERASHVTGCRIPSHWQKVVDEQRAEYRSSLAKQDARMPTLAKARQAGKAQFIELASQLDRRPLPNDAVAVWHALSSDFTTEWEVSGRAGIALEVVCAWLPIFISREMVVVRGTALAEPHYRRAPFPPRHPDNVWIWDQLNSASSSC
jgi:hypothetical protein